MTEIDRAYNLVLGRAPDEAGRAHYLERGRSGLTLSDLILLLLESQEFSNLRDGRRTQVTAEPLGPPAASEEVSGRAPASDLIHPQDVIRQLSLADLAETADEYYRRVDDVTPLMSKPFAFLHEAPEMLQSLGLLLAGLQLGKTMSVLDFGAGTCWLSRCLAQLNCRPFCCDVSPAALAVGQRLFDALPLLGTAVYRPIFLVFDGRHIDLPNESVDRVICFDAFHHVPNQEEVLAEFSRVLKPGGIAGFSEPGRQHSRSPQSQYEMKYHRVLENDIDLTSIFALARPYGFTALSVRVFDDMEMPLADYEEFMAGSARVGHAVATSARDSLQSRSVFFLHKGPRRPDSRSHLGLAHRLEIEDLHRDVVDGAVHLSCRLTNTGEATWLHTNDEIFGIVRVATHLHDGAGHLLDIDHSRHPLPRDVSPGESLDITIDVPVPSGECELVVDLVAEGVTWFENVGSRPVTVRARRP